MIDLHMHILPGVDDGAQSWEEAVEMASMAVKSGTEGVVATSHGNIDDLTVEAYSRAFWQFKKRLKAENIPLKLYHGMEVFMGSDVAEKLDNKELLTINDSRYVLVEFDFGEEIWIVQNYLELLEEAGYVPVIAHAERYVFVQKNPEAVFDWASRGYVIQVNKGSFVGSFGRREQDMAMSLLKHNLVHVIASDAHGAEYRTPAMEETVQFLRDYIDEDYLDLLMNRNPEHIVDDEDIETYIPIPYGEIRRF